MTGRKPANIVVTYHQHSVRLDGDYSAVLAAAKAVRSPCMRHPTSRETSVVPERYGPLIEQRLARRGHQLTTGLGVVRVTDARFPSRWLTDPAWTDCQTVRSAHS
jgi:hypothetical protein